MSTATPSPTNLAQDNELHRRVALKIPLLTGDVAEFRQAIQLRGRLTTELVDRAMRRADAHDLEGAAADLELVLQFAGEGRQLAMLAHSPEGQRCLNDFATRWPVDAG